MSVTPASARRRDSSVRLLIDAFGARAVVALFSVISVALVSRRVGPSVYGVYVTATAFTTLLLAFTDLGSTTVLVREGVTSNDPEGVTRAYVHVRWLLILGSCLFGAALVPLAFPSGARTAAWLSLGMLIFSGASVIAPIGQLHGDMRRFRTSSWIQGAGTLVATISVLVAWAHPSPLVLVASNVVAASVATAYAYVIARDWTGRLATAIDWPSVMRMAKTITLIGMGSALTIAYARIDGILVLDIAGPHAAGVYGAAYRILDQVALIPAAVLVPISPLIARELRTRTGVSPALDSLVLRVELLGGIGLALITIGSAPWVASALLGGKFAETGRLLIILAVYQGWAILAFITTTKLIHANRQRLYVAITAFGLVLNLGVNLVLIPTHGAYGAAVATLITEFATVLAYTAAARKLSSSAHLRALGAMATASAAMAATMLATDDVGALLRGLLSGVMAIAGIALFALLVIRLRALPQDDARR